ncbi:hypothetical protein BIW11_02737 [Tropilaelaps mercedesae]|uniref:Uncharacterized protein n=1 Tax=Tropilaelaps mercedesae TaxID=418985 RepID=A0A1V9XYA7_9ACAR|nr:hypothetical protein BIW11_02737 [Tropilaelaps mercedesae]
MHLSITGLNDIQPNLGERSFILYKHQKNEVNEDMLRAY